MATINIYATTLAFALILVASIFITFVLTRFRIARFLPESAATLVLGIGVGAVIRFIPGIVIEEFSFGPGLFYFVLLPPIIFEAGFTMKKVFHR
jgi:sodium/hydrogen exchanger 8